jgi:DNA-binding CsgD family transcriptional regulator
MGDWIRILESAYDMAGEDRGWLQAVADVARPGLDCGVGLVAYFFDASRPRLKIFDYVSAGAPEQAIEFARRVHSHPMWRSAEMLRATYRSPSALRYSVDMGNRRMRELLSATGQSAPSGRVLLLNAADPSHRGCVFGAVDPAGNAAMLKRKAAWSRVAAHIAAGLRLRRRLAQQEIRPSVEAAILSPSGVVLHAEGPAKMRTARDALRDATMAIEKARGRLRRSDPDAALKLWRGLLDGRWSLIDRFEQDGRRLIVAHRNNVTTRGLRALTFRERQVAAYAALGHSNKLIAYELGLSLGSVGTHLTSVLMKLGAKSRIELVQLASCLHGNAGAASEPEDPSEP